MTCVYKCFLSFLWVEMHQPSHLKGIREIPMSEIPVTTTMTQGLQITAAFCECTRTNNHDYAHFNMFNPQTEELLWTKYDKMRVGTAPGANAGPVWTSAISPCGSWMSCIQSRHPNTKLPICTTRDQQVPIGMDSYLGDGTGTLDTTKNQLRWELDFGNEEFCFCSCFCWSFFTVANQFFFF